MLLGGPWPLYLGPVADKLLDFVVRCNGIHIFTRPLKLTAAQLDYRLERVIIPGLVSGGCIMAKNRLTGPNVPIRRMLIEILSSCYERL